MWRGAAMAEQSTSAVALQELSALEGLLGSLLASGAWQAEQLGAARGEVRRLSESEELWRIRMHAAEAARGEMQVQVEVRHDASIQLRPSFAHVDEDEARKAAADGDFIDDTDADGAPAPGAAAAASSSADADAPGPAAPIAPTFHPAQTQREIDARNRSYAHHLEQQEAEPWRPATLVAEEAAAAVAARERVFVGARR